MATQLFVYRRICTEGAKYIAIATDRQNFFRSEGAKGGTIRPPASTVQDAKDAVALQMNTYGAAMAEGSTPPEFAGDTHISLQCPGSPAQNFAFQTRRDIFWY